MYSGYRIEKRKARRLQVNLAVLFRAMGPEHIFELLEGKEYEGETVDLSKAGTALMTDRYVPEATRLFMKFVIHECDKAGSVVFHEILTMFAQVEHCIQLGDGRFRLGLSFQDVDPKRKEKLDDIMLSPLKYFSTETR